MVRFACAALAVALMVAGSQAAPLKIGQKAPSFSGLEDATTGKSASLADYKDKDVVVLCITCNHCPVAIMYQDRLAEFAKKYGKDSKVALVAISVNTGETDGLPKMKELAKEKGFNFPYLFDGSQKIARDLGATRTPEFFVFNKERRLIYHGAMDDSMKAEDVTKKYVVDAVEAGLKGETPKTETTSPVGCGISFAKKSD